MKLRQALGEYRSLHDHMAVWEEVARHLRKFTVDEGGLKPEKTVASLLGGGSVPEEVVQTILQAIEDEHVAVLDGKLEELGDLEFQDDAAEEEQERGKKKGSGRTRASRGEARGGGGKKPLRAV